VGHNDVIGEKTTSGATRRVCNRENQNCVLRRRRALARALFGFITLGRDLFEVVSLSCSARFVCVRPSCLRRRRDFSSLFGSGSALKSHYALN
jgi:hypothetical protein